MNQNPNSSGCAKFVATIGVIASLIGIFTFLTRYPDIPTIVNDIKQRITDRQTVTPDRPHSTLDQTPIIPTPTVVPEIIDSGSPNVSIKVYNNAGAPPDEDTIPIRVEILDPDGRPPPIGCAGVRIAPVTKDFTGVWNQSYGSHQIDKESEGKFFDRYAPSGMYVMSLNSCIIGNWGLKNLVPSLSNENHILFPIVDKSTTVIRITFLQLELGLIHKDGTAVTTYWNDVHVACQGEHSGEEPMRNSEYGCYGSYRADAKGLMTVSLFPGTYAVQYQKELIRDIVVQPGEQKRVVLHLKKE